MNLYAWSTPAFFQNGSPVDHTWVTDYDCGIQNYPDIQSVQQGGLNCWYCWGSFHAGRLGQAPIAFTGLGTAMASCLVTPNTSLGKGTICWYGIDGVCHQVANQVLYSERPNVASHPVIVSSARGYRVSSSLFGTYGRRARAWREARALCQNIPVAAVAASPSSLLITRMLRTLRLAVPDQRILRLETERREMLSRIDDIAFSQTNQLTQKMEVVNSINREINSFLAVSAEVMQDEEAYSRVFGIEINTEIFLVDPELFQMPPLNEERPERNARDGW